MKDWNLHQRVIVLYIMTTMQDRRKLENREDREGIQRKGNWHCVTACASQFHFVRMLTLLMFDLHMFTLLMPSEEHVVENHWGLTTRAQ